jgi:hypothetical protein
VLKHTWSDHREWAGFTPTAYTLNGKLVWGLSVIRYTPGQGVKNGTEMTIGEAITDLRDRSDVVIDQSFGMLNVKTSAGEFGFAGPSFNVDLLSLLLSFHKEGLEPFSSRWFWYDSDSVTDDPHESYSFFVVSGDRIVRERVALSDYHGNGFNPDVFVAPDHSKRIWFRDPDWEEAWTRLWYRKFYRETRTGQLMVLRPDEPALHYLPEARWQEPVGFYGLGQQLSRIHRLLIFLLIAACVIIFLLWK